MLRSLLTSFLIMFSFVLSIFLFIVMLAVATTAFFDLPVWMVVSISIGGAITEYAIVAFWINFKSFADFVCKKVEAFFKE